MCRVDEKQQPEALLPTFRYVHDKYHICSVVLWARMIPEHLFWYKEEIIIKWSSSDQWQCWEKRMIMILCILKKLCFRLTFHTPVNIKTFLFLNLKYFLRAQFLTRQGLHWMDLRDRISSYYLVGSFGKTRDKSLLWTTRSVIQISYM